MMGKILLIGILAFVFLILQKIVYERLWYRSLKIQINFATDHIFEGEEGELKEIVENRKRLPLATLKVKFMTSRHLIFGNYKGSRTTDNYYRNDVFRIGGGEKVTRTLKFTAKKRGYYTINEANFVASDLFFLNQMVADKKLNAEIYVYPRPYNNSKLHQTLIQLNGDMLSKRHLLEDPFEYRGIREYQPYDDMRSINWKATAKTGDFKVNQRNFTSLKSVRVFFNIQDDNILKKEDCVEMSLRLVASICLFFLRQGIQVACYGNGVDVVTHYPVSVPSKAGEGHMDAIYKALARVDIEQPTADFVATFEEELFKPTKGTFTFFVSPHQYDDYVDLLERYQDKGNQFIWFYPVEKNERPELPPKLAKSINIVYPE